nr:unnamed protein product [Digitaria exilis]
MCSQSKFGCTLAQAAPARQCSQLQASKIGHLRATAWTRQAFQGAKRTGNRGQVDGRYTTFYLLYAGTGLLAARRSKGRQSDIYPLIRNRRVTQGLLNGNRADNLTGIAGHTAGRDDMLFGILLQLLDAPLIFQEICNLFVQTGRDNMKITELIAAKLLSSILYPVHLFHLFLFLLHYDHMVLVDYLISKDVGVHCAQYLLSLARFEELCEQG